LNLADSSTSIIYAKSSSSECIFSLISSSDTISASKSSIYSKIYFERLPLELSSILTMSLDGTKLTYPSLVKLTYLSLVKLTYSSLV
jgi:hypothetical protein